MPHMQLASGILGSITGGTRQLSEASIPFLATVSVVAPRGRTPARAPSRVLDSRDACPGWLSRRLWLAGRVRYNLC